MVYTWLHKKNQLQCQETPIKALKYSWHRGHLKENGAWSGYWTSALWDLHTRSIAFQFSMSLLNFVTGLGNGLAPNMA